MSDRTADEIWRLLARAVEGRTPFTAMQLATVGAPGPPGLRTVILRRFDAADAALSFISHAQAPKVREILAHPQVALGAYDPGSDVQLRLEGVARVVADAAERRAVWALLRPPTRSMFSTPMVPGTALAGDGDETAPTVPAPDEPTEHYALIQVVLQGVELLDIAAHPHARVGYRRSAEGWIGGRIAP